MFVIMHIQSVYKHFFNNENSLGASNSGMVHRRFNSRFKSEGLFFSLLWSSLTYSLIGLRFLPFFMTSLPTFLFQLPSCANHLLKACSFELLVVNIIFATSNPKSHIRITGDERFRFLFCLFYS